MYSSDVHPLNAPSPIDSIPSGSFMDVRDVHSVKSHSPISEIESANVTYFNDVHPLNDSLAYVESGTLTDSRDVHPLNESDPRFSMFSGRISCVIPVQPWNASELISDTALRFKLLRDVHLLNAPVPMSSRLSGATMEKLESLSVPNHTCCSDVHPWNISYPIFVTVPENVTSLRLSHSAKSECVIDPSDG